MDNIFALTGTLMVPGIMTAIAVLVPLCFLDIRKVAGYHILVDVLFSVALIFTYAGTFSGMVTAFIGGLFFSFTLFFLKKFLGYAKWSWKDGWVYHVGWW